MTEKEMRDKYYPQAKEQTLETLPAFLDELMSHDHEYGSICCALAAGAVGAANALNSHKQGGITGFQAGAVMWEFIRAWNHSSNKCGMSITDYDHMLYAQYEDNFTEKTVSRSMFESLQKEASAKLKKDAENKAKYDTDMGQYKKDLAAFVAKYPDYHDRKSYYDHLGSGTGTEWDAYNAKKDAGFEFAPKEPYYASGQLEHWQSIVDGIVPFGHTVKDD